MNKRIIFLYIIVQLLVCYAPVSAQRLYDEQRDKQAQDAAKLADEILNKTTFESQLKNLDTFAKRDLELYFRRTKNQTEYDINAFRTWGDVTEKVKEIDLALKSGNVISDDETREIIEDLDRDCKNGRRTRLGRQICDAQVELNTLKNEVKASEDRGEGLEKELKTRLEKIDEIQMLAEKASTYFKSADSAKKAETVTDITNVFLNMARSYVNFTAKIKDIRNQPMNEMRLILNRIAVETLQLEADHWQTIGDIYLRRADEQADLSRMVLEYQTRIVQMENCLGVSSGELAKQKLNAAFIEAKTSFNRNIAHDEAHPLKICRINTDGEEQLEAEQMISYMFNALYNAAGLVARGKTPKDLASLRAAQEAHRFSIRQSAIIARGYEIFIQSGTKRLGRYYAGGIKPEKIAQLIYAAATVAIPAVIAGK